MGGLIVILLLIAAGIACLWLPRGRRVGGKEPRCAKCDYIVYGLPGPICPECGADLSAPGAIVTHGRRPPARLVCSLAWSAFCALAVYFPLTFVWETMVIPKLPTARNINEVVTLSQPASGGYQSIAVRAHTQGSAYPGAPDPPPSDLKIELTDSNGTVHVLAVDPATCRFREIGPTQTAMSTSPLEADALTAWLQHVGVQGSPEKLHQEMSLAIIQLHNVLSRPQNRFIQSGGSFSAMGSASSSSQMPIPLARPVPFVIASTVWLIGILFILLRRSSRA